MPTEQMRRADSALWCGSALNISLMCAFADNTLRPKGFPAFLAHSGSPPQVPGDAHDARDAEVPAAAAAALGSASEGSRRFHSGSEVPETY
jgi:hypothetical protein